jgi:cellulose synthase operon protein C
VEPVGLSPLAALLRALGSVQAPGARELLEGFTRDTSVTLRAAARVGLVHLGPEGVALARAGLLEPEREVQRAVAEALAAQGETGQAALWERLSQGGNERPVLLEVLARTAAPASAAPLLARLVEEGGSEAVLAAQLLGRLQAREALPSLLKALEDPTSLARREVLLALGQLGAQSVADTLARDLYHDLPEVRAAAATALARVGSAAQAPALEALQGDYYQRVREAASAALTNQGAAAGGAR